ncbi:Conjugative transposon protein TraO [compost metagenome]
MQAVYRYLIAAVLAVVACQDAWSQRMVGGTFGLEAGAGMFSARQPLKDFSLNAALVAYTSKGNYQRYGLEYGHREHRYRGRPLSQETFMLDAGYVLRLFGSGSRSFSINAGLSGAVGYESFNRGDKVLPDGALLLERDGLVYGVQVLMSLEFFVSDRIVLLLQGKALALWDTSQKQFRPSSGMGIRINLN